MDTAPAAKTSAQELRCRHCHSPVPDGSPWPGFCCGGCEAVHGILQAQGLGRYYALGGGQATPVGAVPEQRSHAWLEPLQGAAEGAPSQVCTLELDVQGIHCAACVWLMNELFRRESAGASLTVNPAVGKLRLQWRRGFDLEGFVSRVESFGYQLGPSRKGHAKGSSDLLVRLGVSAAITMNVMLFSIAFYAGLSPGEGAFRLFTWLTVALSSVTVAVGGWPFFRAAVQGLRNRVLHLDLPIALGIVLVFGVSLAQVRDGRGDLAYFDTLNTFITLMLLGRLLQQRAIERNRRYLLEDDGAEGISVRREAGAVLERVAAPKVRRGDVLLVAPGELLPVDAALLDAPARVRTDWMTGESDVHSVAPGELLPAGAFNAGAAALRAEAKTDFSESGLGRLLRSPADRGQAGMAHQDFWNRVSTRWVVMVLVLSAVGVGLWWPAGPEKALQVAVALLVVTCPCAIGIALPLAYELAQSRLRRAGFYVRHADLMDRLARVRTVVFDKTGTLTLGRLRLSGGADLERLGPEARDAAYNLAVRSTHPVSAALSEALGRTGARYVAQLQVEELPGQGLRWGGPSGEWRLGRPGWAVVGSVAEEGTEAWLSHGGVGVARFAFREAVRRDAAEELSALRAEGFDTWLLSGDRPEKVERLAAELGIPASQARAAQSPEDKAAAMRALDAQDTLYLGDGVNDAPAFEASYCAGTPAIDRPVMPGRSDFFLLGEGLSPLREGLRTAQSLRATVRKVLALALAYNVVTVAVSLSGHMTPLRAAVVMPLSSLTVILLAVASLRGRAVPARAPARQMQEAAA